MKKFTWARRVSPLWCIFFLVFFYGLLFSSCDSSPSSEVAPPLITDPVDAKAVLFIGNSLTNNNSMAEMVRRMAATTQRALLYDQHAPGRARIADHVGSAELETKLASRNWDVVTIQAQSGVAANTEESLVNTLFPDILTLVEKVHANNSSSVPLFYMTWGRKNGDDTLCDILPENCTYEGMSAAIKTIYLRMAELADGQVSPCGEVWSVVRERHPELQLYHDDEIHPSILGSYAVALSFYTMIFNADPTLTSFHRDELDAADEQLLREIVKEVVFDRITEWR